jgi:hypothetical protein
MTTTTYILWNSRLCHPRGITRLDGRIQSRHRRWQCHRGFKNNRCIPHPPRDRPPARVVIHRKPGHPCRHRSLTSAVCQLNRLGDPVPPGPTLRTRGNNISKSSTIRRVSVDPVVENTLRFLCAPRTLAHELCQDCYLSPSQIFSRLSFRFDYDATIQSVWLPGPTSRGRLFFSMPILVRGHCAFFSGHDGHVSRSTTTECHPSRFGTALLSSLATASSSSSPFHWRRRWREG